MSKDLAAARAQAERAERMSSLQQEEYADSTPLPATGAPALYVRALSLTNIRCFETLRVDFTARNGSVQPNLRTVLLGDNGLGKSTVLRSLSIALCNESDAVALMKALPGPIIRQDADEAEIRVSLCSHDDSERFEIVKSIRKSSDGSEVLRQRTTPADLPWNRVFICGYGTQRTAVASSSFDRYSPRSAVSSLFDEYAALQNPELVLLRQQPAVRKTLQRMLTNVMLLDDGNEAIRGTDDGLRVSGPWGDVPFASLSDGYRSTAQWLLDLFAWMIHAGRRPDSNEPLGILLIDEIEQHLHPRWQRHIIQRLSKQLPGMQIIATTHTPLVASGVADIESGSLMRLYREEEGIGLESIDPMALSGKRADQVLVEFFDLVASRNPGSSDDLKRLVHLRSKDGRDKKENEELATLDTRYRTVLRFGETEFERTVEEAVDSTLSEMIKRKPDEEFSVEVKRQLRDLFDQDEPEHD